jgi:hypothetical protein
MNVAAKHQPKMHSAAPFRSADMSHDALASSVRSQAIRSGIDGELHDIPGSRDAQFVNTDYQVQRHMAYDSQFVQPAYSGHGKVRVGTTSAL